MQTNVKQTMRDRQVKWKWIRSFSRSEELHGVKYCYYVGDGGSKTFKGILNCEPYENFPVFKKECVDHVQKRMGTRLRNLKKIRKVLAAREN